MRLSPTPLSLAVSLALATCWRPALAESPAVAASSDPTPLTVVVVGAHPADVDPNSVTLDDATLQALRAATSDTASLLRDVPGLSLYGAGGVSSLPVIRGLADDRLRIKVDGMDLVSACGNHMNPPLSYIDPSRVAGARVFAGIAPVSTGGDSIGGTILVDSAAPEFAAAGEGTLLKGEAGTFYRSNGNAVGANLSATAAGENLSLTYSASAARSDNYTAGGDFKPAGLAFVKKGPSLYNSTTWLAGDEVGSTRYESINQSLDVALRHDNHLIDLKLGHQHIPYQGFPNQRMDMTDNTSSQVNLHYSGRYDWGLLDARVYREHTEHAMNFLEDKAYWYLNAAAGQTIAAPGMPMYTDGRNTGVVVKGDIALSARDLLRTGVEYQRYRLDDWWPASGNGGMSPNTFWNINGGQRDRYAAFAEWEAQWTPQWLSQLGVRHETVRMDAGPVQGYNASYTADASAFNASDRSRTDRNWDLTALARYTPGPTQTIEFGYARKTRSPNLYERYTWSTGGMAMYMVNLAGDGNGYVGNLALQPEVAHTLSATFDWHDARQQEWGIKLTPYFTYVDDYVNARRLTSTTVTDQFVFLRFVNQDAQLYGFDLSGHAPLARGTRFGSFTAHGVLSYVRGKTTSGADDNLYNIMPLNARLSVRQRIGAWSNVAEVLLVDAKSDVSQIRNEVRTPAYGILNLRGSHAWKQARLDFGVENVFDRLYYQPLGGAYVGQGVTMPPTAISGATPVWGIPVPGMGRTVYAGVTVQF
ncbi:TonB-dependent receptor [Thiobacillus sedimenti]|uniref:TonB-dependent receptor n=1 Tax=Thiobacillus sedimenti TaxID=3110231 RepID=A0ABZ1CIE1_9PROT|nr:TonB-dependent receptor [Thiobacillus sp. SCUT-2]WRS39164.1 TonB-dependent receptor [Thiobacillus sp. SCUT-2]